MSRVPMLIVGNCSSRSLVSQISFDDDSLMSNSTNGSPVASGKRPCKWSSGTEPLHSGLESSPVGARAERRSSTEPIPKPERKGSRDDLLFDLSIPEARSVALKKAMLGCQTEKQPQQGNPIDKYWSKKRVPTRNPIPQGSSSRGKMANAQWDLAPKPTGGAMKRNSRWDFPENDSGPSLGTLLSTIASSSGSSSGGRQDRRVIRTDVSMIGTSSKRRNKKDFSKMKKTFSRISMDGSIDEGTVDLRQPSRAYASNTSIHSGTPAMVHGSSSSPLLAKNKKNSFTSTRRASCHHSTMPLTMPVRKTSTQDLLNLASNGSSNALRSKLSRSKLQSAGSFNPLVPRRIGSASSMVRIQSREHLRRHR